MKRAIAPSLLALAVLASPGALASDAAWDAPFTLQLGAFRADANTTVRLDTTNGNHGTELGFESDLGMTKTKTLPDIEFLYRFNSRHGIEGSWVNLKRSGERTVTGEIHWGDVVFPVNTAVDSSFDSNVFRVAYRYSPINENGNELALLLGAHYTSIKTSLSGRAGNISQEASVDVPLPTLGVRGSARFADGWRVTGFGQFLKLKIGDYDGELVNASAAVEWAFLPQAYGGVGYVYYHYKLTSEKERARGEFKYRFDGPTVYLAWTFR